jgi:heme exporter protein D
MYWNSFDDFLRMGGYGLYVWGSYVVVLLAVAGEAWSVRRRLQRAQAGDRGALR